MIKHVDSDPKDSDAYIGADSRKLASEFASDIRKRIKETLPEDSAYKLPSVTSEVLLEFCLHLVCVTNPLDLNWVRKRLPILAANLFVPIAVPSRKELVSIIGSCVRIREAVNQFQELIPLIGGPYAFYEDSEMQKQIIAIGIGGESAEWLAKAIRSGLESYPERERSSFVNKEDLYFLSLFFSEWIQINSPWRISFLGNSRLRRETKKELSTPSASIMVHNMLEALGLHELEDTVDAAIRRGRQHVESSEELVGVLTAYKLEIDSRGVDFKSTK